jgi:CRISPR/Cas system-associated protein Cas10 (large subunit of type III CRISPR-Cas system)
MLKLGQNPNFRFEGFERTSFQESLSEYKSRTANLTGEERRIEAEKRRDHIYLENPLFAEWLQKRRKRSEETAKAYFYSVQSILGTDIDSFLTKSLSDRVLWI